MSEQYGVTQLTSADLAGKGPSVRAAGEEKPHEMCADTPIGGHQLKPGVCCLGNSNTVAFPTVPKQITVFGMF